MEFVFVVPRAALFGERAPQGLIPFGRAPARRSPGGPAPVAIAFEAFEQAALEHGFFVERAYAERTPALKQVIPYTIVHRARGEDEGSVLLVRRLARGGEARLHEKLSIGIGGHVNPEDLVSDRGRSLFEQGSRRELEEELVLEGVTRVEQVGLLNDDANAVGAVHVGLVQVLRLQGAVRIREEDVLDGRLVSPEELGRLRASGADFETWSSLLVDSLDELLTPSHPVPLPIRT